MHRSLLTLFALTLSAAPLTSCMRPVDPPAAPGLECRLEAERPLTAGGPVPVRFTVSNPGERPVYLLRWNTPLEGWVGTIFSVTAGGTEVPYSGPMVKRGDPSREDYVEIAPGGSVSATVDFAEVYELKEPGTYRVEAIHGVFDLTADAASLPRPLDRHEPAPLHCNALDLRISTR